MFDLFRYSGGKLLTRNIIKHHPLFYKARFNVTKQRLKSLNNRTLNRVSPGARKAFSDEAFHIGLSRGSSSVTPVLREDSSQLHHLGPFYKNSAVCLFIGWSHFTYWRGRTVVFPLSIINVLAWYLNIIPQEVKEEFKSVEHPYIGMPSYIGSFITLSHFSKFNEGFRGTFRASLLDVSQMVHRLRLPCNVPEAVKSEVYYAKIAGGTHPGIITRSLLYSQNRRVFKNKNQVKKINCLHYAVRCVLNTWDKISRGEFKDTAGTYCIGSREKISVLDVNDYLKLRPLWIPEITDILVCSTWLEKLKDYWGAFGLFQSEIWLGHADQNMRYLRRVELDVKFKYAFEFDGKQWDSTLISPVIVQSINILSSAFVRTETVKNHFKFIMDTLVIKRVILHNGNSFVLNHGMPSGHVWTSMVNSISNWLIWTSTMLYCPYVPRGIKQDYALQIHGDDIALHTNVQIDKGVREQISRWQLENFNYVSIDGTVISRKSKVKKADQACSFLRRVTIKNGIFDTKIKDIWEKMLFGPEYSNLRGSRITYLRRRFQDLAVWNHVNAYRLMIYIAFIELLDKFSHKQLYEIFKVLFHLTDGFTKKLNYIWDIFLKLTQVSGDEILRRAEDNVSYNRIKYKHNYFKYSLESEYVEYWKERSKSATVTDLLRNFDEIPLDNSKNVCMILHSSKRIVKK